MLKPNPSSNKQGNFKQNWHAAYETSFLCVIFLSTSFVWLESIARWAKFSNDSLYFFQNEKVDMLQSLWFLRKIWVSMPVVIPFFMFGTVQLRRHIMKVCYSNVSSRPRAITVQGIKQKIVLMNLLVVLWCVEKAQFGQISIGQGAQNISDDQCLYSLTLMSSWDQSTSQLIHSNLAPPLLGGWAKQLITVCTVRLRCQNMVDLWVYSQPLSPS